jgi:hypothetical protein
MSNCGFSGKVGNWNFLAWEYGDQPFTRQLLQRFAGI